MPGSIEERGAGVYRLRYDLAPDPASGKRRQRILTLRNTTRRQAERKLAELVADVSRGVLSDPSSELLRDFLPRWLATMKPTWRHTTYMCHATAIRCHLVPVFGHRRLRDLTPQHIQHWYATSRLNTASLRHYARYLGEALNAAVEWELIPRNPYKRTKPPRQEEQEREALSLPMLRDLLSAVANSWVLLPALLSLTTGMRPGELTALKWSEVDLAAGLIRVRQARSRKAGGGCAVGPPKTRRARRVVNIGPGVVSLLAEHRQRQDEMREIAASGWRENHLVICKGDGSPIHPGSIPNRWRRLLEIAGLPRVRFYDLRHAAASYVLAAGVDVLAASRRMGHATPSMTLNVYGHLIPGRSDGTAEVGDELLKGVTALPAKLDRI